MNFETLTNDIPDFAKDAKLNFTTLISNQEESGLTEKQFYGTILASVFASKNEKVISEFSEVMSAYFSEQELKAIKAATVVMAMNNIYYRFLHMSSDKEYSTMPARLRMNVIANPGIDKIDFEIYCLAVSVINGCGACMDAHALTLTKAGIEKQMIQNIVRIAAIIQAVVMAKVLK